MYDDYCLCEYITRGVAPRYADDVALVCEARAAYTRANLLVDPASATGFYSGGWNYNENEYNWFLHQQPEFGKALSEEKFKETIRQVNQKWVDAGMLFANINKLIRALLEADLQNTWWYASKHSETDFQALAYTLSLAIQRGAEQVRIKII